MAPPPSSILSPFSDQWKRTNPEFPCPKCFDTEGRCSVSRCGRICHCINIVSSIPSPALSGRGYYHYLLTLPPVFPTNPDGSSIFAVPYDQDLADHLKSQVPSKFPRGPIWCGKLPPTQLSREKKYSVQGKGAPCGSSACILCGRRNCENLLIHYYIWESYWEAIYRGIFLTSPVNYKRDRENIQNMVRRNKLQSSIFYIPDLIVWDENNDPRTRLVVFSDGPFDLNSNPGDWAMKLSLVESVEAKIDLCFHLPYHTSCYSDVQSSTALPVIEEARHKRKRLEKKLEVEGEGEDGRSELEILEAKMKLQREKEENVGRISKQALREVMIKLFAEIGFVPPPDWDMNQWAPDEYGNEEEQFARLKKLTKDVVRPNKDQIKGVSGVSGS